MEKPKLYRIGELSKLAKVSSRTIDYYTTIGLLEPAKRSATNYRLYNHETLVRLERIESMKKDKYTLDEIKESLQSWSSITQEQQVSQRLIDLQNHLSKLEREVKELEPELSKLKPKQANKLYTRLMPQTAACIEALMLLLNKSSLM